jgi:hypothetical protein
MEYSVVGEVLLDGSRAHPETVVEEKGCDVFTFGGGKIVVKDTYLK